MEKLRKYLPLHLSIAQFSLTGVFSKMASIQYNQGGLHAPLLYVFGFLMLLNCGIYALAWQRVIKRIDLSVAYAHRSVYLIWSQIWAILLFREVLTLKNVIGILILLTGVILVGRDDS
ncbi:MAG: EamA family transporter [Eubacterium sp.]|nr:EamA family transporter [Eubacterium sp.]